MIRLLVCGARDWNNLSLIRKKILEIGLQNIEVLIEGEAKGADILAKEVMLELGFPKERILKFPANWAKYHRAAGAIRNRQMLVEGKPTLILAFHYCIQMSKGTLNMLVQAKRAGIEFVVCMKNRCYSVYLLQCSDDSLYCGITKDLETRVQRHNAGSASKYTRSRLPVKLVCSVGGFTRSEALKIEHKIKKQKKNSKVQVLLEQGK